MIPSALASLRGIPPGNTRAGGVVTADNSVKEVKAGGSALADRTAAYVVPIDAPIMVYPVNTVSTTVGLYIPTGERVRLECSKGATWYMTRYSGNAAVSILEVAE